MVNKQGKVTFKGLLKYLVAKLHRCYQVQFHFQSPKIFSRAFFGAGPLLIQVAGNFFTSLQQTQKTFSFTFFINFLLYGYSM